MVDEHGRPRILVITNKDKRPEWEQFMAGEAHVLSPMGAVYGARYDLILVDDDFDIDAKSDLAKERIREWLRSDIACRTYPGGRIAGCSLWTW